MWKLQKLLKLLKILPLDINTTLWNKIDRSLDSIRPYLQKDGGDIEIVGITDDMVVEVKLLGACKNCPQSFMTMKTGVEESVKRDVPEITAIKAINI